jgi:hypothetical protein
MADNNQKYIEQKDAKIGTIGNLLILEIIYIYFIY